ncbi:hypothetical protein [Cyclobacterium sp. SYSU L10401]|uniref:hypothetical protein n=1 Tax=Cyclobacterium sp. SYSU L10401 TaxID=2678657 RepID=UPI0013D22E6E|nr:hypothetical protein [Cyclobacterium sp. SYSU L10401]
MQPLPQIPLDQSKQEHLDALLKLRESLSRNNQYGKGIISGLELESGANHTITIKEGFGFTSRGLPIEHPETVYTHFTPYSPPPFPSELAALIQLGESNKKSLYRSKEIYRLIKKGEADKDNDTHLKHKEDLAGFVVTLVLEAVLYQDSEESFVKVNVVPLLVPKGSPVFEDQLPGLYFFQRTLRFNPRKGEIRSGNDVLMHFLELISNGHLGILQENMVRVWDFYAPLLGIQEDNPFSIIHLDGLLASFKSDSRLRIMAQYLVDFIEDLCRAFTEFLEKTKAAIDSGQLDPFPFPLHLALGTTAKGVYGNENKYRHSFQRNTFTNAPPDILEEAAFLLRRLGIMASAFDWVNIEESSKVIVTPSMIGNVETAARAIPIYYDWGRLKDFWKFTDKVASFPYYHPMGYFNEYEMNCPSWVNRPLDYNLGPYNFFKIEGHIGKHYTTARQQLNFFRSAYSLPFQLLVLSSGDFTALLQDESKPLNGIEHKAGVTKGGTFILVFNDNESIQSRQNPEATKYAEFAESLRWLNLPLGEHVEKVIAALDIKAAEQKSKPTQIPDHIVIADFYLPYYFPFPQPEYPSPSKKHAPGESASRKPVIELKQREFCETDGDSYMIRVKPEGGKLRLDDKELTIQTIVPSVIGPGEYTLTYELEGHLETIRFKVSQSLKPKIVISQIAYTEEGEWDIAFASSPTVVYPLGWQLSQYQYNDDNKEHQGIFRSMFKPSVGEMRVSLEIQNPPPCMYTYTYKKLIFEQKKEYLCHPITSFTCSLERELPIIPVDQREGIQMEASKIRLKDAREIAKGKNEIIVPIYQETATDYIFTVVQFLFLDASFQATFKRFPLSESERIQVFLKANRPEGQSNWQVNGISCDDGAEIILNVDELGDNFLIVHGITFKQIGCEDRLEIKINSQELLEALRISGTHTKTVNH